MPTVGSNSKPAYVYDTGTDTWIPIGPGEHTHDYSASAHNHDSTYIAKTLTTTTGDIIYASGANTPARLSIGSTGQVLSVSGGVPAWATPAGGGKVLQAVFASYGSPVSSTSSTYATTNVTATITPSSTTSKIAIISTLCLANNPGTTGNSGVGLRLVRGATVINVMGGSNLSDQFNSVKYGQANCTYLDSPSTTSATTYTIQFARTTAGTVYINGDGSSTDNSTILLLEIGA